MYDSAIGLFQEAVRLNSKANRPPDATFHYHLGLAYQKTGQTALARKELESVLQINPKFGDAGDVKKVLAELR
jgi:tetratricopeptide (TPR) repeat protein